MPTEGPELDTIMSIFEKVGFPGCMGSMDVVHIAWDRCPAAWSSSFTGKEGFPTVAYEVVVDHLKRIRHVCYAGFPGAYNDKTTVKYNELARPFWLKLRRATQRVVRSRSFGIRSASTTTSASTCGSPTAAPHGSRGHTSS